MLRFTRGNPAHASIYVLADALDYLAACDVRDVQAHVQGMTTAMPEQLEALRIPTLTPADPARHGASVCVSSPRAQAIVDAMARGAGMERTGTHPFQLPRLQLAPGRRSGHGSFGRRMGLNPTGVEFPRP
jgi:selenocysteine lyase/cysteine desulfurase